MISHEESTKKGIFNVPGSAAILHRLSTIEHRDPEDNSGRRRSVCEIQPLVEEIEFTQKGEYDHFHNKTKSSETDNNDRHSDSADEVQLDDGLKLMTADDYLSLRMLPMVAELSKKTPRLSSWSSTFTICVLVLSVSAAALSTFDRSDFVPAALALSGGITAWASYQQTDLRLVLTNNSLSQLNQLLVWWDGLTMIEKRIPINKETLVTTSELAIINQATVVGGAMQSGHGRNSEADASK
jgi:hypothetical protein